MIRHLLEGSKFSMIFLIVFISCKKSSKENVQKHSYPRVVISNKLKKEIFSYKEDLHRMQANESHNLSLYFIKRNDSVFIEIGDYKPNFKMLNIKGVEVIKEDTIYLCSESNLTIIDGFYKNNLNEKITVIDDQKLKFNHHDPHYRCLYVDNKILEILLYNNKCR